MVWLQLELRQRGCLEPGLDCCQMDSLKGQKPLPVAQTAAVIRTKQTQMNHFALVLYLRNALGCYGHRHPDLVRGLMHQRGLLACG